MTCLSHALFALAPQLRQDIAKAKFTVNHSPSSTDTSSGAYNSAANGANRSTLGLPWDRRSPTHTQNYRYQEGNEGGGAAEYVDRGVHASVDRLILFRPG